MSEEVASTQSKQCRLRTATADDMNFLQEVYASSREGELMQLPWSEQQRSAFIRMQFTAQRQHYLKHYPNAKQDLILAGEEPIGRLYVNRGETIHIIDITVLTEHRGKGIGSSLIEALIKEATEAGKPVSIYVESFNPSRRLFERLGFHEIKSDGINLLLERPASSA